MQQAGMELRCGICFLLIRTLCKTHDPGDMHRVRSEGQQAPAYYAREAMATSNLEVRNRLLSRCMIYDSENRWRAHQSAPPAAPAGR